MYFQHPIFLSLSLSLILFSHSSGNTAYLVGPHANGQRILTTPPGLIPIAPLPLQEHLHLIRGGDRAASVVITAGAVVGASVVTKSGGHGRV